MGRMKYGPDAISLAEKRLQALNMRAAGASYDDIAKALGYADRSGSYNAVKAALEGAIKEPAEEAIILETSRLDRLLRALWPQAIGVQTITDAHGNVTTRQVPPDLFAVDRVLMIMQRRARLLGLDAPTKKQITGEWVMKDAASKVAESYGLDPREVLAQAEELLKGIESS